MLVSVFLFTLLGIPVLLAIVAVVLYNGLVGKKNQVSNIFASLDALLKKRYDLIPNLVATVQEYAKHERGLLEEVTALRAQVTSPGVSEQQRIEAEGRISESLGKLMVSVENYPELKANENFMHLQASLTEIEEQISAGRRAYNASVTDYNNALEMFPTNVMAQMMGYQTKTWFEIQEAERQNVDVSALFGKQKTA